MSSPNVNLQDSFLNQVRKEAVLVETMLINGTSFQGTVRGFDNFTVIMNVAGKQHLVYKHSIAQLVAPKLHRPGQGDGAAGRGKPAAQKNKNQKPHPPREAKRPEKFNALDLSEIKLDESKTPSSAENEPETVLTPKTSSTAESQPQAAPAPATSSTAENQPETVPTPKASSDAESQPRAAPTLQTSDEEAVKS